MDSPKPEKQVLRAGTISRLTDKGFGFIRRRGEQKDLFFNGAELIGVAYSELREGDQVEFDIIDDPKGLAAAQVRRNGMHAEEEPDTGEPEQEPDANEMVEQSSALGTAVQQFTRTLAEAIAENPRALEEIEWRDLERVIAEAFSGLGLDVELTPSSKDGGKDVVVSFTEANVRKTYFVEIKHWRSGKVGKRLTSEFVHVVARAKIGGGIMLATQGYTKDTVEGVTKIERQLIGFGTKMKMVSLCRDYAKARSGVWEPPENLERVVFDDMQQ